MLMMSPLSKKALRKQKRRERDKHRGKLGRERFSYASADLAKVMKLAFEAGEIASIFGLEGPLRATIRSDLCLVGWRWRDADNMARELLEDAFRKLHAMRPSWYEGQREWVIHEGVLIERTRCMTCGKKLPEGHKKFCSRLCAHIMHDRVGRVKRASEDQVVWSATKSWI